MAGNHKPVVRGDDYGIWRRIHLVPFVVTIPPEKRDADLVEKLRDELPGILNWALAGYQQWRKRKLDPPRAVTEAVESYKEEMDVFGTWLQEYCETGDEYEVDATYAFTCFKGWSAFSGFKGWTSARFGRKVKERYRARRTAKGMIYTGFRPSKDADLFCVGRAM